jgi:hypothetical protein
MVNKTTASVSRPSRMHDVFITYAEGWCRKKLRAYLLLLLDLRSAGLTLLLLGLALLQESLWDEDVILGGDASAIGVRTAG